MDSFLIDDSFNSYGLLAFTTFSRLFIAFVGKLSADILSPHSRFIRSKQNKVVSPYWPGQI